MTGRTRSLDYTQIHSSSPFPSKGGDGHRPPQKFGCILMDSITRGNKRTKFRQTLQLPVHQDFQNVDHWYQEPPLPLKGLPMTVSLMTDPKFFWNFIQLSQWWPEDHPLHFFFHRKSIAATETQKYCLICIDKLDKEYIRQMFVFTNVSMKEDSKI